MESEQRNYAKSLTTITTIKAFKKLYQEINYNKNTNKIVKV